MVHVRVGGDGVMFATNLSGGTATPATSLKIWRWENDSNPAPDPLPPDFVPVVASVAWEGDPAEGTNNQRWGDTFDVKGAGAATKLVLGARNNAVLCVLDTTDGLTFTPHILPNSGSRLLLVSFDPDAGTAAIEQTLTTAQFPAGVGAIGVQPTLQLLGAIHVGENPNNHRLYNHTLIAQPGGPAVFVLSRRDGAPTWIRPGCDGGPARLSRRGAEPTTRCSCVPLFAATTRPARLIRQASPGPVRPRAPTPHGRGRTCRVPATGRPQGRKSIRAR